MFNTVDSATADVNQTLTLHIPTQSLNHPPEHDAVQPRFFDLEILPLGVSAVSTAAVLIREAAGPVLVIASYRRRS